MERHTWPSNLLNEGLEYITAFKKQGENWITVCSLTSPYSKALDKTNFTIRAYPFRKISNVTITSKVPRGLPEVTRKFSDGYNVGYGTSKTNVRFSKNKGIAKAEEWSVLVHIVNLAVSRTSNTREQQKNPHTEKSPNSMPSDGCLISWSTKFYISEFLPHEFQEICSLSCGTSCWLDNMVHGIYTIV